MLHLPNVEPGRARIGRMAGKRTSAVSQGIAELEGVGIAKRRQSKIDGGDFATNHYDLADLADPAVCRSVLARLRRRGAPGKTHVRKPEDYRKAAKARWDGVCANAHTGSAQTRTQSHHQ